jgi:hypothetical protein
MTPPAPIHVVCDELGSWRVKREDEPAPVSQHGNATDAERAALRCAESCGAPEVIIHDRYGRLHRMTCADS